MEKRIYFRIRKPGKDRGAWSIESDESGKWQKIQSEEIDAINQSFREGSLSRVQAQERMKRLLKAQYAARDRGRDFVNVLPGNATILKGFVKKVYTPAKRLRMGEKSFESMMYMLNRAIHDLGDVPVDGPADFLQNLIDKKYRDKPGSHIKRITAINRLRKHLGLTYLLHLSGQAHDVLFITEEQLKVMVRYIADPMTRLLAEFLFYTGLRLGEAFAVLPQNVKQQKSATLITVSRQMLPNGEVAPTKTRSNRKAFVIPGGESIVKKWAAVNAKQEFRDLKHNARIKKAASKIGVEGFYLHCLRHSYCVHLIGKGCTVDWVAQSAGHSREVCERYYSTHKLTDDAVEMMQIVLTGKVG